MVNLIEQLPDVSVHVLIIASAESMISLEIRVVYHFHLSPGGEVVQLCREFCSDLHQLYGRV